MCDIFSILCGISGLPIRITNEYSILLTSTIFNANSRLGKGELKVIRKGNSEILGRGTQRYQEGELRDIRKENSEILGRGTPRYQEGELRDIRKWNSEILGRGTQRYQEGELREIRKGNSEILGRRAYYFRLKIQSIYVARLQAGWLAYSLIWPHNGIVLENMQFEFPGFSINGPGFFRALCQSVPSVPSVPQLEFEDPFSSVPGFRAFLQEEYWSLSLYGH